MRYLFRSCELKVRSLDLSYNKLIDGHNQAIERLTETRDLLQADLQKLEPSSTTTTTKTHVKD